jgi:HEAT repeat protein
VAEQPGVRERLSNLFEAERLARGLHDQLVEAGTGGARAELMAAIVEAIGEGATLEADEATVRLVCLARLLGEFDGDDVADALIDVLDSDHPEARSEAGEQLQGLAYDRFKEVAQAVERALVRFDDGANALVELPYILVDIPEGGVTKLLGKFLAHGDADVVAAAIEALVEVGDPSAIGALGALSDDTRVSVLGEGEEETEVQIGELACEAIELLGGDEDDPE